MAAPIHPRRALRGLAARSWGMVCLALVGLLIPPAVNPCPVRAGLTKSSAASCCATRAPDSAPAAPVRSCCARKAAAKAPEAQACKMQGSCCCKARPTPAQAVVVVSRPNDGQGSTNVVSTLIVEPALLVVQSESHRLIWSGGPAHLNRLFCSWQV